MLKITVDNSNEKFGDKVSIADLAQYSFNGEDSHAMHIYRADAILERDWRFQLLEVDMEYVTGVAATFKDGSKLHVGAWADCCDGSGCKHCEGR